MKFLTLEGIDGSGKTTLYNRVKELYQETGVEFKEFPGEHFFKNYTKDLKDSEIEELHQQDKLKEYVDSKKRGIKVLVGDRGDVTQKVYNGTQETSVESDVVVYLDIGLKEAFKRMDVRGEEDNLGFEKEDVLKEKKELYEKVLRSDSYKYKTVWVKILGNKYEVEGEVLDLEGMARYLLGLINYLKIEQSV